MKKYPNEKKSKLYGPNIREYEESGEKTILSHSQNDSVRIPDNVTDQIVSNNIVNAEFDYTKDSIISTDEDDLI